MKDKFVDLYMKLAQDVSQLSYARRLKVGTVIVKDNVVTYGYNGTPAGWDNNCEDERIEYVSAGYGLPSLEEKYLKTRPETLHSEANALMKIANSEGATLFCTHSPCIDCAKMIYQAGIFTVYYRDEYKSTDGIEFLKKSGVDVKQHE
jgi:dCMP deaminase